MDKILKVDLLESNGSLNVFVTNTSTEFYGFIAEISVTIGSLTRYFYGDFEVGGRMVPPQLGQSKLLLHTGGDPNYSATVHYWVADGIASASSSK